MKEFKIECPHCGQPIMADSGYIGQSVDCPDCGKPFIVKDPDAKPPEKKKTFMEKVAEYTQAEPLDVPQQETVKNNVPGDSAATEPEKPMLYGVFHLWGVINVTIAAIGGFIALVNVEKNGYLAAGIFIAALIVAANGILCFGVAEIILKFSTIADNTGRIRELLEKHADRPAAKSSPGN